MTVADTTISEDFRKAVQKLDADTRNAARRMGPMEARFLVSRYYDQQKTRIAFGNRRKAAENAGEPCTLIEWISDQEHTLERRIASLLDAYSSANPVGEWIRSHRGAGPIIAAGILAHISIERAEGPASLWSLAGMDPSTIWESASTTEKILRAHDDIPFGDGKPTYQHVCIACRHFSRRPDTIWRYMTESAGEGKDPTWKHMASALARRPHNAELKTLMFHFSSCVVRAGLCRSDDPSPNDEYRRWYDQAKARLIEKNNNKGFTQHAARTLRRNPNHAQRATYEKGFIPSGHLEMMAKRWISKLFLSHLFEVWHLHHYGKRWDRGTYAWRFLGHKDHIAPPRMEMIESHVQNHPV